MQPALPKNGRVFVVRRQGTASAVTAMPRTSIFTRSYAALNCEAPVSTIDTPPAGFGRSVRHERSIEYVFLRRDIVIL